AKVDAVTGATFTSKALIENVQKGLKYYQEKK
nr:FMN-binding protein [Bacteroidales bacterium]